MSKKENRLIETEAPRIQEEVREKVRRFAIKFKDAGRYIRYIGFLVAIGMVYIWNSHVAENQVKEENKLRQAISDAKAEYKTMHARLSAGTRRQVIFEKVDSLGLQVSGAGVFKLTPEK